MTIAKQDGICTLGCLQKVSTISAAAAADAGAQYDLVFAHIFYNAVAIREFLENCIQI